MTFGGITTQAGPGIKKGVNTLHNEFITGRITVEFGDDTVHLAHKVNGRLSYLELFDGDHIELVNVNSPEKISIKQILNTIVERDTEDRTEHDRGRSFYEGVAVKVELNKYKVNFSARRMQKFVIKQLLSEVKLDFLSQDEAINEILKLQSAVND